MQRSMRQRTLFGGIFALVTALAILATGSTLGLYSASEAQGGNSLAAANFSPGTAPTPSATPGTLTVGLSWAAVTLTGGAHTGTIKYTVVRTQDNAVICSLTASTTCTDTTGTGGTSYTYTEQPFYMVGTSSTWSLAASSASTAVTYPNPPVPSALFIESKSGGTAGKIEVGDHIGVTFNQAITAASVCAGKSATFTSGVIGTVTIKNNAAPSTGNDELFFTGTSGCTSNNVGFAGGSTGTRAGYIDLGSTSFVTADATVANSNLTFISQTNNVRLVLGPTLTGGGTIGTVTNATATYVPDTAIQNGSGVAAAGSVTASDILTLLQPTASAIGATPSPRNGITDSGDKVTYTFSGRMDPNAIKTGWDGTSTAVTVTFDTSAGACSDASCMGVTSVNLGGVDLSGTYVKNHGSAYTLNGTIAMVTTAGQSVLTLTFTSSSGSAQADTSSHSLVWSPSASATDLAANPMSTATVTEAAAAENF